MDCRTPVRVSSTCGPIAALVAAVPMVSAAMPISEQIRVNRSRASSPAYPPSAYAAGTISGTAPYVTLRWPTAVSIRTPARENLTAEIAPTDPGTDPVSDSVMPAPPGLMIRSANATLDPDGVSSQDTRYGCPLTLVVVVPDAITVPPELRSCISSVPAAFRYTSNFATVPAESISARFQFVVPDAESPAAGTEIRNRVQLLVAVPPAGTVAVIDAPFSCGIPSLPLKSVHAARDSPACPVTNDWTALPVPATEPNETSCPEPVPSSIGQ